MSERQVASKTFGKYMILHTIGKGEFGKVKLAYDPQRDLEVAIKFIKRSNITSAQKQAKLEREINILQNLNHPNIVHLYDVIETEKYIGIVMAYANGGELFEYISENQYLSEEESAKFFLQLLDGVQYLHNLHIVHRDLKLENLLLDQDGNIVITDFGFANNSRKNPSGLLSTSCGSPCYAAPELVINDNYVGEAADIWSCGIILYAMLCGYLPFDDDPNNPDGENLDLLYKYILESQLTFPDYISEDAQELVCGMLIPDPEKRWPMEKVLSHKWLRNSKYYKEKMMNKERMNESMDVDYIYDESYVKYLNESTNSEIEKVQEDNKVPEYESKLPPTGARQNMLDEETEVFDSRNNNNENIDLSIDKTEYLPNQEVKEEAKLNPQNNPEPEIENKQSISQTTISQEFVDAQQELPVENEKNVDPMEVEEEVVVPEKQGNKMEVDEEPSPVQVSPEIANEEDQDALEVERQNAEKQLEKLINDIEQEELTQLEEMKDQLQEVVKDEIVENNIEEAAEEQKVETPIETPIETSTEEKTPANEEMVVEEDAIVTEKPDEEVVIPENIEVEEEAIANVQEDNVEKVEEVKETEAAVEEVKEEIKTPETEAVVEEVKEEINTPETEAVVEEVKEEINTPVTETVTEDVNEVKENEVNIPEKETEEVKEEVPETVKENVEEKKEEIKEEKETKAEDKIENSNTIKLDQEDLKEVDEISHSSSISSSSTASSSSSSSSESKKSEPEKKVEEKTEEDNKKPIEDVKPEEAKNENGDSVDVEMKDQENTTLEEDEVSMLKKTKKTDTKEKKNSKKRRKDKKKKNIKKKIKENKVFRKFFGCILKN